MAGYAANFGSSGGANTVSISGAVNSGALSIGLTNNNNTNTNGFNLVGNPYPSPISWDASSGWTKSNVDNAIYFFNASGDQYSGTYSSYVNGVGDGPIIAAMQGFFVHVTSGSSGTLGVSNPVRITNSNPTIKDAA